MAYLTVILVVGMGLVCGSWLVINGHPWFGLLAMLIGGSISIKDVKDK